MNDTPRNETALGRSIAVISARLPYIDRRSLSEAWFSALHLASDRAPSPNAVARVAGDVPSDAAHAVHASRGGGAPVVDRFRVAVDNATARTPRTSVDASVRPISSARRTRAESTFACARSYAPFRTSLTLGVEGERVALLLRREGPTLHVVALCRPAVADLVRRALGCADLHLRARGESVRSRVEMLTDGAIA